MRKIVILALILLYAGSVAAQCKCTDKEPVHYLYTNFSFDVNMAFGLKDNTNTQAPDRGFDWDLEVGVRADQIIGVYGFYGQFLDFDYQNYGAGVDVYVELFDAIDGSIGVYYTQILRKDGNDNWGSYTAWASPKAQLIFWRGNFGLTATAKYQQRPDIDEYVFEGQLGLTFKIDRN